jgi:hypothetical protein
MYMMIYAALFALRCAVLLSGKRIFNKAGWDRESFGKSPAHLGGGENPLGKSSARLGGGEKSLGKKYLRDDLKFFGAQDISAPASRSPVFTAAPAAAASAAAGLSLMAAGEDFSLYSLAAAAAATLFSAAAAFLFTYLFPVDDAANAADILSKGKNDSGGSASSAGETAHADDVFGKGKNDSGGSASSAGGTAYADDVFNKGEKAHSINASSDGSSSADDRFSHHCEAQREKLRSSLPDFHRRTAALMMIIYALVLSWRGATAFSLSLSTVTAYAASLIMSRLYGAGGGALAATAAGISHGVYAPVFAIAAAVNGALASRFSPGVRLPAAAALAMGWAFFQHGLEAMSDIFPELIIVTSAAVPLSLFLFSDKRAGITHRLKSYAGTDAPSAAAKINFCSALVRQRGAEERMKSLSAAMSAVGDGLDKLSRRMNKPMRWECRRLCDSVMSELCPSCPHTEVCWNREYSSTAALCGRLAASLSKKGAVEMSDLPEYLIARCPKAQRLTGELNCRFGALLLKCGEENPAAPDFLAVAGIIDDVAALSSEDGETDGEKSILLRDVLSAAGLRAGGVSVCGSRLKRVFIEDIRLPGTILGESDIREICERTVGRPMSEVRFSIEGTRVSAYLESLPVLGAVWGRAAAPGGREISGDSISVFSGEGERLVALLSDGMGSGEEAALMSGVGTVVMKRLLTAGCSTHTALRLLNRVLCADRFECTVTMDILEVDKLTGRCTVTKSGAAPSFVVRDGRLYRLSGETLPLGILSSPDSSLSAFEGRPGDTIVMMSDGVDAEEECPWLADLLADPRCERMGEEELAQAILDRRGGRDDATAMVVRLRAA